MTKPFLLCLIAALSPALAANPAQPAATAVNALGIELLGLTAKPWESTLLSPYSIQSALAMTYAGAEGDTRAQMAKVLHYPAGDIHAAFSSLQQQLDAAAKQTGKITLVTANRLFGQKGYDFRTTYLAFLKDKYGAPLDQLDFQRNSVNATKTINAWVEKQTQERIRNLIPSPLSPDTRLVLVNAIYLKAPWAKEFVEGSTKPEPFHLTAENTSNVPTMVQEMTPGYAKQNGFTAITLPYVGERPPIPHPASRYRERSARSRAEINAGPAGEMRQSKDAKSHSSPAKVQAGAAASFNSPLRWKSLA